MARSMAESRNIPIPLVVLAMAYLFYGLGRVLIFGSVSTIEQLISLLAWISFFLFGLFLFLFGLFKLLGFASSSHKTLAGLSMAFVALYFIFLSIDSLTQFSGILLFISGLLFFVYMFNELEKIHLSTGATLFIGAIIALGIWFWDWSHGALFISDSPIEGTAAASVFLGFLFGSMMHGKSDIRALFLAIGAYIYGFALVRQFQLSFLSLFSGISFSPGGMISLGAAIASLGGIILVIVMSINFVGIARSSSASRKV